MPVSILCIYLLDTNQKSVSDPILGWYKFYEEYPIPGLGWYVQILKLDITGIGLNVSTTIKIQDIWLDVIVMITSKIKDVAQ
jgi:hypothetical protein